MMIPIVPLNRLVLFVLSCALFFLGCHPDRSVSAQEAEQAADNADFPEINPATSPSNQVIIKAVRDLDPQTPIELTKSLNTMFDLEEYEFARYYLARLQALKLDDQQKFEVYDSIGSGFFLSLHASEALQPEGKAFAKDVLAAANRVATSPDRLKLLVIRLSDRDPSVRSTTIRTLRKLGPAATAEMLHAFTDSNRQAEFPSVRQALKLMGDDAIAPLLGGARADYLQVQAESVRALGSYRSPEATNVMMRTYLSPRLPESLRRIALNALMQNEGVPANPILVEERFYQQANDLLLGRQKLATGLLGEVTLWKWDADSKRLVPTLVPTPTATQIAAAQIAADLHEIRPELPRNRALHLLTHLESEKLKVGPSRRLDVDQFRREFDDVTAFEIEQVLVEALRLKLIPAATGCCELLGVLGTQDLVYSDSQKARPLIEAILLGDRYLQFAAFEAIKRLNPQMAYQGSSYVLSLAVFLAASEGREAGLVGDNRSDIAQSYASMMSAERLVGYSAVTGQELFVQATLNPDIEMIVVTDSLQRPNYMELIQQLRNDMRTKRLPIALLIRESENHVRLQRVSSNDPLFTYLPMSLDQEQIGLQVRRLKALTSPWHVELLDRQHHANVAADWLKTIASDRNRYRFYDLGSRHKELARIVYRPGLAKSGSVILKSLGTPMAQRELLNFVGQSSFPLEDRQAAAEAFAEAIKHRGALLTREEILHQYDRYNASEGESVETQKLLGSILDALEKSRTIR